MLSMTKKQSWREAMSTSNHPVYCGEHFSTSATTKHQKNVQDIHYNDKEVRV